MTESKTALASAARTATTTSADFTQSGARGVVVYLDVTASAAGTGGLQVQLQGVDPTSGNAVAMHAAPTAVTAISTKMYIIYPGASSAGTSSYSGVVPNKFNFKVTAGDSSSYTYSVSYCLIP